MRQRLRLLLLTCLALPPVARLGAQNQDSLLDAHARILAVQLFHRVLKPETRLYNGSEYVDYSTTIKTGHPYFETAVLLPGYIVYDGVRYDGVNFRLDLVKGLVVLDCPNEVYKLQLRNELVSSFSIDGHPFIRITVDSSLGLHTGFYELLYSGNGLRLLERHGKNLQENVTDRAVEHYIIQDSSYYLEKAGRYFPINHRKTVLEVMADHREAVQVYMRKNHLRVKKNKTDDLRKIVSYYAGLNP